MKYFLDTEFIECPIRQSIQLISLALVSEDNRTLYLVSSDFQASLANDWVKENVLSKIDPNEGISRHQIKNEVLAFINNDPHPEFWGYYSDYDWVAFCWLFGAMTDLPLSFPMYCKDFRQLTGDDYTTKLVPDDEHNALSDAIWLKKAYDEYKINNL